MVSTLQHFVWGIIFFKLLSGLNISVGSIVLFLLLTQLPDFDFIAFLFEKKHISADHRTWFHNIFFLIFFPMMIFFAVNPLVAFIAIAVHFTMDLFDGKGIPLFFPISNNRYLIYGVGKDVSVPVKFFYEKNTAFTLVSFIILFLVLFL